MQSPDQSHSWTWRVFAPVIVRHHWPVILTQSDVLFGILSTKRLIAPKGQVVEWSYSSDT